MTAAAIVCVIAAAAFAPRLPVFTAQKEPPASGGRSRPATMRNGCPVSRGTPPGMRWTAPTVRVASGTLRGEPWVLCARTGARDGGWHETLCTNWRLGDGPGSGMDCVFSFDRERAVPLDEGYFEAQMGPDDGYVFGATPRSSASVALRTSDGPTVFGEIHPAPKALRVPFAFFTLFAEPYAEGTLVVRNESGEVLERRRMEHGIFPLSVRVEGEGTVTGYRTELLRIYEDCRRDGEEGCRAPRPVWIDCPDECRAGLAGAGITLVAEPAEGVAFAGWSGDCSGTERCELVVDRATDVTATFVRESP